MDVGFIGLGRMGLGMGTRLVRAGHSVSGFDVSDGKRADAQQAGIRWVDAPAAFAEVLKPPRVVIIMVPAGPAVDKAIEAVAPAISPQDVLIDGGNTLYKDSVRRAADLESRGIRFLDAGVSGGVWGLENGFCLMVGGDTDAYATAEPVFRDLAPQNGCAHVGPAGAGHFAKMVHNGIEYGMLQAYAEGFEILQSSQYDFDLAQLARLWNRGSVVRSWLLELAQIAFEQSCHLEEIRGWVEDSGEGRWTVLQSIEESVPAPVIALSLMMRFRSRQDDSFSAKVIAALRNQFGGHAVKTQ